MRIEDQDTQPLPIVWMKSACTETSQERFRRLKEVSDATGVRFLFVYLIDKRSQQTFGLQGYLTEKHDDHKGSPLPYPSVVW